MIEYLVMDVDGTLTDGKIYIGPAGEALKAFSVKDGYSINYILKPANITPVVITARNSMIVQKRCDELGITEVHQGKIDKFAVLKNIVGEENLGKCAYFGDDIIDLRCMKPIKDAGGIVACPADAVAEVKAIADYICINNAGEGALREFSEWLVSGKKNENLVKKKVDDAVTYLRQLEITERDAGIVVNVDDNFYYTVQSYCTKPEEKCKFESHRKYIDIQIIISGKEYIDLADIARLSIKESYDKDKDIMFWNAPAKMCRTTLSKGDCIVIYPEMAHRGAISFNKSEHILKIVGKVKVECIE